MKVKNNSIPKLKSGEPEGKHMAVVPGNRLHLHESLVHSGAQCLVHSGARCLVHSGAQWFLTHTALLSPPTWILTSSRNTPTDITSNNHDKPVGLCCVFFRNIQWLPCLSLPLLGLFLCEIVVTDVWARLYSHLATVLWPQVSRFTMTTSLQGAEKSKDP